MNEDLKILIQNLRLIAINPEIYTKEGIKTMCEKAADLAEQVLEAGEELNIKKIKDINSNTHCSSYNYGECPNQQGLGTCEVCEEAKTTAIADLCLPIVAKLKMKAEGYKQAGVIALNQAEKEISKLKLRVAELEGKLKRVVVFTKDSGISGADL